MNGLQNLDDLFLGAQDDGLTDDTMNLVIANLNGPTMMTAVGTPLDELETNEVTLAMNIIDMSGSMAPHANALIDAYNDDYLAAMRGSSAADDILISTILFNRNINLLHGYVPLEDAQTLDRTVYQPDNMTALYDAVASGFTNMVLYAQQLRQSGVMVRCLVMVYSDGDDNASKQRASDIKKAAQELLDQELYTLIFVAFTTKKAKVGFKSKHPLQPVADAMGFPQLVAAGLNHSELRRVFHMASVSAIQVSQHGAPSVLATP